MFRPSKLFSVFALFLCFAMVGCQAQERNEKIMKIMKDPSLEVGGPRDQPSLMEITIYAEDNSNVNPMGENVPVNVWIYQLSDNGKFLQSEFEILTQDPSAALNTTFVDMQELQIRPGKSKIIKDVELQPKTNYLGVVAGYLDIEKANWRAVEKVNAKGENYTLLIAVKRKKVTFNLHR